MKRISLLVTFITMLATSAFATPILDQSSNGYLTPVDGNGFSYVNSLSTYNYGASFVADTTSLDGAGMYFSNLYYYPVNPSAIFTISLYDSASHILGSGTFTNASSGWNDVFFNDVAVNLGSTYYVFASSNVNSAAVTTFQYGNSANYFGMTNGVIVDYNNGYNLYSIDARIFTNNSAVPEPATLALLGLGLFGFAAARRRKQ